MEWLDSGHCGNRDMQEGVALDVSSFPAFSSPYITSLDLSPVQMALAQGFTIPGDKSSAGGVSPWARSTE